MQVPFCLFTVTPTPVAPGNVQVIQQGITLTFHTSMGDGTGTINPDTGDFVVVGDVPQTAGCPGTRCTNTTTGNFDRSREPVTFTGNGRIDVYYLSTLACTITYNTSGTRTSCAPVAASTLTEPSWLERWRRLLGLPLIP
jgi:hypothetical protein